MSFAAQLCVRVLRGSRSTRPVRGGGRVSFTPVARALLLGALGGLAYPSVGQHIDYARPVSAAPTVEDIGAGYTLPVVPTPPPRATWREAVDLGVLAVGLGLAAWIVLKTRSRAGVLLIAAGGLAYFGFYREGCICPIGAVQNVSVALTDPAYSISYFVIAFFFLPLIFALLFGRVFCAGVCPLGAIQELAAIRPVQVPRRIDRVLTWLPWVYLGLAIWFATRPLPQRDFVICRYDPFVGFFRFTGALWLMLVGAGLLVVGVFIGRPYCRYLCPYGAILSLLSRFSWRGVTITPDRELDCGLCDEACPYGAIEELRARKAACLACARCYRHCPRQQVCEKAGQPLAVETGSASK
ncbi:MAG: 4Fe-4S binding protein [Planctomycetota bacterium]